MAAASTAVDADRIDASLPAHLDKVTVMASTSAMPDCEQEDSGVAKPRLLRSGSQNNCREHQTELQRLAKLDWIVQLEGSITVCSLVRVFTVAAPKSHRAMVIIGRLNDRDKRGSYRRHERHSDEHRARRDQYSCGENFVVSGCGQPGEMDADPSRRR